MIMMMAAIRFVPLPLLAALEADRSVWTADAQQVPTSSQLEKQQQQQAAEAETEREKLALHSRGFHLI